MNTRNIYSKRDIDVEMKNEERRRELTTTDYLPHDCIPGFGVYCMTQSAIIADIDTENALMRGTIPPNHQKDIKEVSIGEDPRRESLFMSENVILAKGRNDRPPAT